MKIESEFTVERDKRMGLVMSESGIGMMFECNINREVIERYVFKKGFGSNMGNMNVVWV
jgi:hypothetical protein